MDMSELKLGHTYHFDTEELSGVIEPFLLTQSDTKFITVELKLCGKYEISEFSELSSALEHSRSRNIVYRFIEYLNSELKRHTLVIQHSLRNNKLVGFRNGYYINRNWKLFINSQNDVTVQHIDFPKTNITVRFSYFPTDNSFYLHLSCLIYVLTNYEIETVEEIKNTFKSVKNHMQTVDRTDARCSSERVV